VQKEIRRALDKAQEKPEGSIYIIPAKLEDCPVANPLNQYQWVNLFERNGYKKLLLSLVQSEKNRKLGLTFEGIKETNAGTKDRVAIPVLGSIAAGEPLLAPSPGKTYIHGLKELDVIDVARSLLPSDERGMDLFALKVQGESMIDAMINDGDIVIMKPATKANNGEMVAIRLPDRDETTLKYFFKEKDQYRLQPANPTMRPIMINKNERLEIKGRVVMVIRGMESLAAA
jgi:repressor LexA